MDEELSVPELAAAVRGAPQAGGWDQIFTVAVVDDDGFPHTCLLSRASLGVDGTTLRMVLASASRTLAYLRRRPRATVAFIEGEISYACACEVVAFHDGGHGLTGVATTLTKVRRDTLGIPLTAASFQVTDALAAREAWERSAALLAEMAGPGPDGRAPADGATAPG
jgi:hypothetical protein